LKQYGPYVVFGTASTIAGDISRAS
jgi:hypothetical protein